MSTPPELPASYQWSQEAWGPALRCVPLGSLADHLFSTRRLALDRDGKGAGWEVVSSAMGVTPGRLIRLTQVHGTEITVIRNEDETPERHDGRRADIVLSAHADVAVAVQVADCVPLLLADARTGAVAAVHAGWRGLAAGAARIAVQALLREWGSRPLDLTAAVGPSIGPCCYEVGDDVREAFMEGGFRPAHLRRWFVPGRAARPHLDQWAATRDQLVEAGLPIGQVHSCDLCTRTHRNMFFSYRGDGSTAGRMVGVIRARPRRRT